MSWPGPESYKFCPICGGRLENRLIRAGEPERLVCTACGFIFYMGLSGVLKPEKVFTWSKKLVILLLSAITSVVLLLASAIIIRMYINELCFSRGYFFLFLCIISSISLFIGGYKLMKIIKEFFILLFYGSLVLFLLVQGKLSFCIA